MPVIVDYVLEDASGVGKAMDNHIGIIKTRGNGQKKRDSLAEGITSVTKLNSDQMRAQNFLDDKTSEQNDLMQRATKVITGIHNAAKSTA